MIPIQTRVFFEWQFSQNLVSTNTTMHRRLEQSSRSTT